MSAEFFSLARQSFKFLEEYGFRESATDSPSGEYFDIVFSRDDVSVACYYEPLTADLSVRVSEGDEFASVAAVVGWRNDTVRTDPPHKQPSKPKHLTECLDFFADLLVRECSDFLEGRVSLKADMRKGNLYQGMKVARAFGPTEYKEIAAGALKEKDYQKVVDTYSQNISYLTPSEQLERFHLFMRHIQRL